MKRLILWALIAALALLCGCSAISYTGLNAQVLEASESALVIRDTDNVVSPMFRQSCKVTTDRAIQYFDEYENAMKELSLSEVEVGDMVAVDMNGSEKSNAAKGDCRVGQVRVLCSTGIFAEVVEVHDGSVTVRDPADAEKPLFGDACELDLTAARITGIDPQGGSEGVLKVKDLRLGDILELTLTVANKKQAADGLCRAEEVRVVPE